MDIISFWSAAREQVKLIWPQALGVAAIHLGKRVRFFNAVDLVNLLEHEKQQNKTGNLARRLIQVDAVILDELGYLPFTISGSLTLPFNQSTV